jgi:hypothetical protein
VRSKPKIASKQGPSGLPQSKPPKIKALEPDFAKEREEREEAREKAETLGAGDRRTNG